MRRFARAASYQTRPNRWAVKFGCPSLGPPWLFEIPRLPPGIFFDRLTLVVTWCGAGTVKRLQRVGVQVAERGLEWNLVVRNAAGFQPLHEVAHFVQGDLAVEDVGRSGLAAAPAGKRVGRQADKGCRFGGLESVSGVEADGAFGRHGRVTQDR